MFCSDGGDFEDSLEHVSRMMNVNTRFSYREEDNNNEDDDPDFVVNGNNRNLWKVEVE